MILLFVLRHIAGWGHRHITLHSANFLPRLTVNHNPPNYYAYVFSSTKSVIRAELDLPETEGGRVEK
jgi:hypothetical protein